MLTDGRLTHGWSFFKKVQISEMVSRAAWARAGPTRAHTGPYGLFLAQRGPVLTNHVLTYHVTAPGRRVTSPGWGPYGPIVLKNLLIVIKKMKLLINI